jgi:filamentous hemagglutinin family protein
MSQHNTSNRTYRLVWSDRFGIWQVVPEKSPLEAEKLPNTKFKKQGQAVLAKLFLLGTSPLYATPLPQNGNISSGSGSISSDGQNALNIVQNSNRMAIDWQSFSIGVGKSVNFIQPSSSSIALNRVVGNDVSSIQGAINANGQVFLINPNGVIFSSTAQVNVGGLIASTRNITNEQFNASSFKFEGSSNGAIINQGNIKVADNGYVVMIAAKIENTGNITANQGTVGLAAGNLVTVDMGGPVKLRVEQGSIDALIKNGGAITADGGHILLTAKAAGDLAASVINNTGNIEATSLSVKGGKVVLLGDDISNSGTIKADGAKGGGEVLIGGDWQGSNAELYPSATKVTLAETSDISANATQQGDGGKVVVWSDVHKADGETQVAGNISAVSKGSNTKGGKIETSGHKLKVDKNTEVKTNGGKWLLDPTDFTISSGDIAQTSSGIGATTLQNNLSTTNIEIQTATTGSDAGNITVDADMAWNANTLTLTAHGNLVINSTMTASGTAGLALNHGWDGSSSYGNNASDLVVHGRIDLANTSASTVAINGTNHSILRSQADVAGIGSGLAGNYVLGSNLAFTGNWTPIDTFTGKFDGLGNSISNLTINNSSSNQGLFGVTSGATLSNIRLKDVSISASHAIGALVGNAGNATKIFNTHVSGTVTSIRTGTTAADTGGLVGDLYTGSTIRYSSSSATVSGQGRDIGGLVGYINDSSAIYNSFATGSVTMSASGHNEGEVGGLVGGVASSSSGGVFNSFSSGNITITGSLNNAANAGAGGIVGGTRSTTASFRVEDSYASGTITASNNIGDVIGKNTGGATITRSIKTSSTAVADYSSINNFSDNYYLLEGLATPFLKAKSSDAFMLNGSLIINQNASLNLSQDIKTVSVLGESTLTLKSQNDIVVNAGKAIRSSGGKLNTVLWADSDNSAGGHIYLQNSSSITTNGGHVWM